MKHSILVFFVVLFSIGTLSAQEINQKDAQGNRHGVWIKKFDKTNQVRYKGQFNHGVETGTFTFYCEDCGEQPFCTKEFVNANGLANVSYFTKKGKLVSKGQMQGKERIGEWLTFQKKSNKVMSRDHFVAGKLDGIQTTYYSNDVITETIHYSKGIKEGANKYYSTQGVLIKELFYTAGQLHGTATFYDAAGNKTIEGIYKNGRKVGVWKQFKNGAIISEERYPKPLLKGSKKQKN